ncbi:MAG: glycosyltransferase, partial [Myxococcales bacterium]|nr:glycosyltransferase [Myxococcales bacterium]
MTEPLLARFWNRDTRSKGAAAATDDELVMFGTVTEDAAVVRLRDRLEKAALRRAVALRPHMRVLDFGGGAGRLGLWLAPHVAEVVVVDFSEALLEVGRATAAARGITNVRFVHGSVLEPPPKGPYDLVLMFAVAQYVDDADLAALAAACAAAVAPGGRLVLKEPVVAGDAPVLDEQRGPDGAVSYRATFRPVSFYPDLLRAGFACVHHEATAAHPVPFFLGNTNDAAAATRDGAGGAVFGQVAPLLERYDRQILAVEDRLRAHPVGQRLLAPLGPHSVMYTLAPRQAAEASPALSVVAIAYNEAEALSPVVAELRQHLQAEGIDFELVLVNDGSTDGTGEIMDELAVAHADVRAVHQANGGIGAALRTGFEAAQGAYVTWVPADGQIAPETVSLLFWRRHEAPMLTTVYRRRDDPWYRLVISQSLNTMIRLRTGQVAKS